MTSVVSPKFVELFLLYEVTIKTRVIPSEVEGSAFKRTNSRFLAALGM